MQTHRPIAVASCCLAGVVFFGCDAAMEAVDACRCAFEISDSN